MPRKRHKPEEIGAKLSQIEFWSHRGTLPTIPVNRGGWLNAILH